MRQIPKSIFFGSFLLAGVCICFFAKPILLRCVAWQAALYCQNVLDAKLLVEDPLWKEGKIFFRSGKLFKEGKLYASFEEASLRPYFDKKHFSFGGSVRLQGLKMLYQNQRPRHKLARSGKCLKIQLDILIDDGELFLDIPHAITEKGNFIQPILQHMQSQISIRGGRLESSSLRGDFFEKEGGVYLTWQDQNLKIAFEGPLEKLHVFLPEKFHKQFKNTFFGEHFNLNASLTTSKEAIELEGDLTIKSPFSTEQQLFFGCSFSKTMQNQLNRELFHKRMGWFCGKQFPLEKFLSPFLFCDVPMHVKGLVNFEGHFDERYVIFHYDGDQVHLESSHFQLDANIADTCSARVSAVHYIDLMNGSHCGFLPLKDAHYWQKNHDFHLENTTALVCFENNLIHIKNIEAHAAALDFRGDVSIAIHSLNDIDLQLAVNHLKGPVRDAQRFLDHFHHSFFWTFPAEGEVSAEMPCSQDSSQNLKTPAERWPLFFHYHFQPTATLLQGHVQGQVHLNVAHPLFTLKQYQAFISYDCKKGELCINEGTGEFLCVNRTSSLLFETPSITVTNFSDFLLNFSCRLVANSKPFCFIHGESYKIQEGKELFIRGEGIPHFETFDIRILHDRKIEFSCGKWKGNLDVALEDNKLLIENFACLAYEKAGFSLNGAYDIASQLLQLEVDMHTSNEKEKIKLGQLKYAIQEQKMLFEGNDFSLSSEKLSVAVDIAKHLFPDKIHPSVISFLQAVKQNEPLEGRILMEAFPGHLGVLLSLKDGIYLISERPFHFKNLTLMYDSVELNILAQCFYMNKYYWMHLNADAATLSGGKFVLSDVDSSYKFSGNSHALFAELASKGLVATWARNEEKGWYFKEVKGRFCEMEVALSQTEKEFQKNENLTGCIRFNPEKVLFLIDPLWDKTLQSLSLAGEFSLEGEFVLNNKNILESSFTGTVLGNNCQLCQVTLGSIVLNLEYRPERIKISDFAIKDWAGRLFMREAQLIKDSQHGWQFDLSELNLTGFRLARLKCPWTHWGPGNKPFYRSLVIRQLELEYLRGNVEDLFSLSGKGKVDFNNLPKKTIFSNLLFLPTEITARIGLDLTTLVPARGIIVYEILDGKIHFRDFKDMFSEGKRSRFYLANGSPAYLDFNGNLNMKIKMKQYNLLMKLAEFFTIAVKGTLFHPTYAFSNQIADG